MCLTREQHSRNCHCLPRFPLKDSLTISSSLRLLSKILLIHLVLDKGIWLLKGNWLQWSTQIKLLWFVTTSAWRSIQRNEHSKDSLKTKFMESLLCTLYYNKQVTIFYPICVFIRLPRWKILKNKCCLSTSCF